ncbi:recombinase family protein [Ferruginibacter sp.]|nr:recombinase family protein [Ferruginibacter sp.]
MTTSIDLFNKWAKKPAFSPSKSNERRAVVYTRVSSKEQFDTNLSLDWQRKTIEEYASRQSFEVLEYFGGVYESAKTDGRKEFQRMLDYARKNKKVTHILVYLLDRFSRTGGGAIKLAKDLREKYGITIIAVTQPIDTSNPGGVFQQNIQFLFSEYDNQLRRQRAMAGIREKLQRGIWCVKPPMGYDIIYDKKGLSDDRSKGDRKIVVNETGKKLRKAFEWKAKGMKNEEILSRLKSYGVKIYKQKLSMIFSNPFYCGIISNKMLEGKLIEGKHEKMVSQHLFLEVNKVRAAAGGKYGVLHQKEHDNVPLKVFMKCDSCGNAYTGYIVKAKNIWYYKCRTTGCRNNKNSKEVNTHFTEYLSDYSIAPHLVQPFLFMLKKEFAKLEASKADDEKALKTKLNEIQKKIDGIEEEYYITKSMPAETYQKFFSRFAEEKSQILKNLEQVGSNSSNHPTSLSKAVELSLKLPSLWASSDVNQKENLQKLIFPDGVTYNRKTGAFRTDKVNEVFRYIAELNSVSALNEKGQTGNETDLSSSVGMARFELATFPP